MERREWSGAVPLLRRIGPAAAAKKMKAFYMNLFV
jgi:hypothetical protein